MDVDNMKFYPAAMKRTGGIKMALVGSISNSQEGCVQRVLAKIGSSSRYKSLFTQL
jgi:hypothetical protein